MKNPIEENLKIKAYDRYHCHSVYDTSEEFSFFQANFYLDPANKKDFKKLTKGQKLALHKAIAMKVSEVRGMATVPKIYLGEYKSLFKRLFQTAAYYPKDEVIVVSAHKLSQRVIRNCMPHEMTHYRQYQANRNIFSNQISAERNIYKYYNQETEREANEYQRTFVKRYFTSIKDVGKASLRAKAKEVHAIGGNIKAIDKERR